MSRAVPSEMGNELRSAVRDNVPRNSVLGEGVDDKKLGKFRGGDGVMGGDEYCMLG